MKIVEQNKITQSYEYLLNEFTCPICGKHFMLPLGADYEGYVYKADVNGKQRQILCSYHCFRAWQKEAEVKKQARDEARKLKMADVFRTNRAKYREMVARENEKTHC